MLPFCRNLTCHLRFGNISKAWNASSVVSKYVDTEYDSRREYSGLSRLSSGLELKKCQNSPLYMANSKRNIEYNLFYQLVEVAKQQYLFVHQITDFEWWAVIVLCTVPLRLALSYYIIKKSAHLSYDGRKVVRITEARCKKEDTLYKDTRMSPFLKQKLRLKHMKDIHSKVCIEENFNPWKLFIINLFPFPLWVANSLALRKLVGLKLPFYASYSGVIEPACSGMETGGLLWFTNFLEMDPYHILPVMVGISFFLTSELSLLVNTKYGKEKEVTPILLKLAHIAVKSWSLLYIVFAWNAASAMSYYWFISGMTSMGCRLLFLHPDLQKRIQPKDTHLKIDPNPYKTIATNMNKRYNPRNWFL